MAQKALIIEDDIELVNLIAPQLEAMGYQITTAPDGQNGLELALNSDWSFILLDLNLPKLEGSEICRQVRESKPQTPIIMLTAQADLLNKVLLLEIGADDYITKPFSFLELKARIRAVLRRTEQKTIASSAAEHTISCGDIYLDLRARVASRKGVDLDLTSGEFDLLALLASEPERVFSREEIVEAVHGASLLGYDAAVTTHINRIRGKLEPNPAEPIYLQTVRGRGYRLVKTVTD